MDAGARIEGALEAAVIRTIAENGPPLLSAAIRHAVFPGGARVRPRLALAVAQACGGDNPALADAAACAIEMLHCASLVHDDLPCFDNADIRRGRPSVHAVFGAPLALLAGDALIVMAFDALARGAAKSPERLIPLLSTITRSVGAPFGIVAGQAWESEPNPPPEQYRCAKTGALFVAATMAGALASGGDPAPWRALGHRLGEAYQVADDLLDAVSGAEEAGKPVGRDAALGRPNTVSELGIAGAVARLEALIGQAMGAIPACPGEEELRDLVRLQALRLAPKRLVRSAA
ncbi:MAG: polyprenyl synthetase family protein [Rhizomicrobium sp.]